MEGQTAPDYYQLLANLALVGTAKNHLEVSGENLRLTETKLRAGAATRLEVDRATADVEAQVQQLASANLQVALVARDLESTTSIAPDISSAPELTDDLHPEPDLSSFEAGLARVPSVAAAATATRAAQQLATSQKLALLPTIAGSFTEYNTNAPGFEPSHWYWQAVVTASWIFDLTNVGNIRSFDAAATATQAAEEKTRLAAGDAIHRYWADRGGRDRAEPVGAGGPGCGGPRFRAGAGAVPGRQVPPSSNCSRRSGTPFRRR